MSFIIPGTKDPNDRIVIKANITWNGKDIGLFLNLMIDHAYIYIPPDS